MRWVPAHPISIPLLLLVLLVQPHTVPQASAVVRARYEIVGGTEVERDLFEKAHASFLAAGLQLPETIAVEFTDDLSSCRGYEGFYVYGEATVTLCRQDAETWTGLRKLILHELGHAWDDRNLTPSRRDAYQSHLGLDGEWLDERVPHDQRPGERLANSVAGVTQGVLSLARLEQITGG